MAEKPEELSLPVASVSRVVNDALPPNVNVSQEARKVIAKTASVFVLYTTATAASLASKAGRKTMNANDVLAALQENDFPQFKEPLERSLEYFRETQKKKKESTTARKSEQANKPGKSPSPNSKKGSPKQKNAAPPAEEVETISDSEGED
ncbi:DNA polymerase epsilon subunit 3 [Orchesella cincta]|uniref:DNA polymerase epsilon subunit 3 n=1 Tax=Orchesella cincta TaxID=48709 RepID=A0A1D2MY47_ORCCI|nr:DNA polymerase epsilon subunit 3 [Orchesella cincta]